VAQARLFPAISQYQNGRVPAQVHANPYFLAIVSSFDRHLRCAEVDFQDVAATFGGRFGVEGRQLFGNFSLTSSNRLESNLL
jgi:hypothetical protein